MVDERRRLLPPRLDTPEEVDGSTCCPMIPARHSRKLGQIAILVTVAFERLAFYSLSGNLVLFLNSTNYDWDAYNAIRASLFFMGISCVFYFLGGCIADALLGRFRSIFIAFVIYIIGYTFFPVLSNEEISEKLIGKDLDPGDHDWNGFDKPQVCAWLIYIALSIVAIGTGIVRANIAPFGADQLRGETVENTAVFFNWYYWTINVGTLVALSGIAYSQQKYPGGFFCSYIAATACLFVGLVIFLSGKCAYVSRRPVGSIFVNIFKIIREAWRIRARKKARQKHKLNISRDRSTESLTKRPSVTSFLDHAKFRFGGSFHDHSVDDIKQLGKILCVFGALIPYWMVYYQTESTFLVQGLHMRLKMELPEGALCSGCVNKTTIKYDNLLCNQSSQGLADNGLKVDIAVVWLCLFDVVLLILLIPLMDRVIYPFLRRHGYNFSMVQRMLVGQVFAVLAIIAAGIVEHYRLQIYWDQSNCCCFTEIHQQIQNTTYYAANMSIFYQVPQYLLMGVSEVFASVAGLEFASFVAPKSMKSSIMGLFYLISGIGSFCSLGVMYSLIGKWFFYYDHGNINWRMNCITDNQGASSFSDASHLDYYFFLLGGFQVFGILLFIFVIWKFNLSNDPQLNQGSSQIQHVNRQRSVGYGQSSTSQISEVSDTAPSSLSSEPLNTDQEQETGLPAPAAVSRPEQFKRTVGRDASGRIGGAQPAAPATPPTSDSFS